VLLRPKTTLGTERRTPANVREDRRTIDHEGPGP
jgi:hypothetical protein